MAPHPLLAALIQQAGASLDEPPSLEVWRALQEALEQALAEPAPTRELVELRQSDERHRLLFDRAPIPLSVFHAKTLRMLEVNDALVELYGYSRAELLDMRITDLKIPEDVNDLVETVQTHLLDHTVHVGIRRFRCKSGAVLQMDISSHMITFEGEPAILSIAIDRTESSKLEEQLRQSQKMDAIGQLAGGVAHDFNNLIAVILANSDLALGELGDHPATADVLEIEIAARRAARLTHQLLAFSRKQPRDPKPLALNAIVTTLEAMLRRIVGEDIAISTVLAPDLGSVEADAGQLEQLLMNLVVNARDAMPAGGELIVTTCNTTVDPHEAALLGLPPGQYVVLAVRDTGCGMTPATRARIFEPFFTTKALHKGTGLGLSTVFGIVRQSAGAIAVDSAPGAGTTFRIYLPRSAAAVAAVDVAPRFVPARGTGTILVVEDEVQVRHVLRRYLSSWGYTLLEAPDGKLALEIARAHDGPIDLLITDLVMPEMDGRTLSRRLLAERPTTAVVFISGYTEHAALDHAALGPDDHFVRKPFTAQELSEAVHRAMISPAAIGP